MPKRAWFTWPPCTCPLPIAWNRRPARTARRDVRYSAFEPAKEPNYGLLSAIDLKNKGKIVWQQKTNEILVGGVLATKGGVVFSGEGNGNFTAFEAASGKPLWSFNCGSGVNAPPISYAIDGKQYVAVAAGGSQIWGFRTGDSVIVFWVAGLGTG